MTEIREHFNNYMKQAPKQLEKLFEDLDENNGIMLQCCFEDFAKMVLEQSQESGQVDALVSQPNEVSIFGNDYDGAISAGKDGWECDFCGCWNKKELMLCRFCKGG